MTIPNELAGDSNHSVFNKETDDDGISVKNKDYSLTDASNEDETSMENDAATTDELHALIAAWETSTLSTKISSESMDLDLVPEYFSAFSEIHHTLHKFEPSRRVTEDASFSPPKRFYRTFWRSVTRRILASSSTADR